MNELLFYIIGSVLLIMLLRSMQYKENMCMCSGAQCSECITSRQQQQERIRECNYPTELIGVV